ILLAAIIFRAVGIEFRSKVHHDRWRILWDWVFSISSFVMALLFGVVLGNLIDGVKIDVNGDYLGTFWDFITPYSVLIGLLSVALFIMHGSIYLIMKTEGKLHDQVRRWVNPTILVFIILYALTTVYTIMYKPQILGNLYDRPWLFLVAVIALLAIVNIPREIKRGKDGFAFLSSLITITALFTIFGIGTFPVLLRSSVDPAFNITIYNAAATSLTYKVLAIITGIGIPLILAYGWWIYRTFRGKVVLDEKTGY
ncbi:MAG: cytochrome d ubiquinol oxidase subunit II, partial [Simkaniaceae bacterium]|nr:cytochrome d ubiquinol oxidase subunit II [Simkaniaceae bacterium]